MDQLQNSSYNKSIVRQVHIEASHKEQPVSYTHLPSIWHENKSGNISSYPYSCALRAVDSYNYLLVNGERRLTPREMRCV